MKKLIKRALFVVALLMLFGISAVAEDISAYGLASSDKRIKIFTDYVGVYSFGDSVVSSDEIQSLITTSSSWSVAGWTDSANGESKNAEDASGGYLILSKSGEDNAYVPLRCSVGSAKIEASGSTHSVVNGFAATSADKQSYVVETGATSLKTFSGVELTQEKTEFTYAFNIYADGQSVFEMYFRKNDMSMCKLFDWQPDGTCSFYTSSNSIDATISKTDSIARGQWHRIVLMLDINRGRFHIYIDGVYKGNSFGGMWGPVTNRLYIGAGAKSTNGSVAIGNMSGCYGMVQEQYETISVSSNSGALSIADDVISVDVSNISDVNDVIALLSANAANIKVYKDNTCKEEADKVTDTTVLVLSNENQTSFRYYKLIPAQIEVSNVTFNRQDGMLYADANAIYNSQNSKPLTAVLVIKDKDGRACKLVTSPTTQVGNTVCQFSLSAEITDGMRAELFFIDSWTSRLGYEYKIYKEAIQ